MAQWHSQLAACVLAAAASVGCGSGGGAGGAAPWGQAALDAVAAKAGTYEGSWEMFGLDAADEAYSYMTWTDVAEATDPRIEGDRALVSVVDTMEMSNGQTYEQSWLEGVLIEPDGSAGQQFVDMDGTVQLLTEIAPGHFQYEQPIASTDYFAWTNVKPSNLVSGKHLTDKRVETVDGKETHHIERVTSLVYEDDQGKTHTLEFTSLAGTHQKTK